MQKVRNCFKGKLALLLVCALVVGMLPAGASEANTARSGYGLNNPSTDSNGITTWDCVWFGNYPQSDATGVAKDPIKWRVLSVNGDDAFLLADTNLDVQRYNDTNTSVTWETCTMRSWLNSTFLNKAFNATEQAAIKDTTVVNEDNPEYGTEGGNNTTDKVYLLSISEVLNPSYGFTSTTGNTDTREAVNTAYVAAGGEIKSSSMSSAGSTDYWWLRSPGNLSHFVSSVNGGGYACQCGSGVIDINDAVRPALHLNLSSTSVWSYAGQVTSEGGETGTETPVPTAPAAQTTPPEVTPVPTAPAAQTTPPEVTPVPTAPAAQTTPPEVTPVPTAPAAQTTPPEVTPVPTAPAAQTTPPEVTLIPTASPVQTTPPAGTVPSIQNPAVPSSAPAQDLTEKTGEDETAPAKVTALKLKAKKKALQASWKKVSGASGYQIWCSTSKKFQKKSVKTTKKTKLTIGKLKAKKVYFVKVRAYTVRDGKKVYGAWSKTMKKKVK